SYVLREAPSARLCVPRVPTVNWLKQIFASKFDLCEALRDSRFGAAPIVANAPSVLARAMTPVKALLGFSIAYDPWSELTSVRVATGIDVPGMGGWLTPAVSAGKAFNNQQAYG